MIVALPLIVSAIISLLSAAGLSVVFVKLWGNGALDRAARGVGAATEGIGTGAGKAANAAGSAADAIADPKKQSEVMTFAIVGIALFALVSSRR